MISNLSLYFHIPFCIRKCRYCDFYSVPYEESLANEFVSALISEWKLVREQYDLDSVPITSVFFGGGTPSLLSLVQWERIQKGIISTLNLSTYPEWTIECNPDSFSESHAKLWKEMGVTRLTFGIQSLNNNELKALGRPHSKEQAHAVLSVPILSEFTSIGVDIMYGLPGQTLATFDETLYTLCSIPVVKHVSAYELAIAKDTCFGRNQSLLSLPSEEIVCDMAALLFDRTGTFGFRRYEVSNFAKQGHECIHNKAYWSHGQYIGLGPAAHSFMDNKRFANIKNLGDYISSVKENKLPKQFTENITRENLLAEVLFLRLRTVEGIENQDFLDKTGEKFNDGKRTSVIDDLMKNGIMVHEDGFWRLTEKGMFVADGVAKRLV
jgi:oxygen-independent coproporphyrinogen-3 oxidase